MRTLAEQTAGEVKKWIAAILTAAGKGELALGDEAKAKLEWLAANSPIILMGGEDAGEWNLHPVRSPPRPLKIVGQRRGALGGIHSPMILFPAGPAAPRHSQRCLPCRPLPIFTASPHSPMTSSRFAFGTRRRKRDRRRKIFGPVREIRKADFFQAAQGFT